HRCATPGNRDQAAGRRIPLDRGHDEGAEHQLGVTQGLARDRMAEDLAAPKDRELEAGAEPPDAGALDPHTVRRHRGYLDFDLRERGGKLFGELLVGRTDVLEHVRARRADPSEKAEEAGGPEPRRP